MEEFDQKSTDKNYLYYACEYSFDLPEGGEIVAKDVWVKIDRHIDWEIHEPARGTQQTISMDLGADGSDEWHDNHARETVEQACLEQAYSLFKLLS